jgi:hypothetical protein
MVEDVGQKVKSTKALHFTLVNQMIRKKKTVTPVFKIQTFQLYN